VALQAPTGRRRSKDRLAISLGAVVLAMTLVAAVAIIRTGPSRWLLSLARILFVVLLSVLVFRGVRWARWVLIAWLSLSALAFMAFSIAVATYPFGIVLFLGMIALFVWAVVEVSLADIDAPSP
jgi:hypothetical protein